MQETKIQSTCQILGTEGIIIQIILATLSFSVLIFKRLKQQPKRSWKIWALDTSKQAISQLLAHFINVGLSLHLSQKLAHDPCMWYVAINVLDNSLGVYISLKLLLFIENSLFQSQRMKKFKSGNYYEPFYQQVSLKKILSSKKIDNTEKQTSASSTQPYNEKSSNIVRQFQVTVLKQSVKIHFKYWMVQLILWNIIVTVSKMLLFLFQLVCNQPINIVTQFTLGWWLRPLPILELILVIIIIPVIMNGLAFWIQDSFLMKKKQTLEEEKEVQRIVTQNNSLGKTFLTI